MKKFFTLFLGLMLSLNVMAQQLVWNGELIDMGPSDFLLNSHIKNEYVKVDVYKSASTEIDDIYGQFVLMVQHESDELWSVIVRKTSRENEITIKDKKGNELSIPLDSDVLEVDHSYKIKIITTSSAQEQVFGVINDSESAGGLDFICFVDDNIPVVKDDSDIEIIYFQPEPPSDVDTSIIYRFVDEYSSFTKIAIKSQNDLDFDKKFLSDYIICNLEYPADSLVAGQRAGVYVQYVLGCDGSVIDVSVRISSGYSDFDNAVLKAIKALPKFRPAQIKGVNVKSLNVINVVFKH